MSHIATAECSCALTIRTLCRRDLAPSEIFLEPCGVGLARGGGTLAVKQFELLQILLLIQVLADLR